VGLDSETLLVHPYNSHAFNVQFSNEAVVPSMGLESRLVRPVFEVDIRADQQTSGANESRPEVSTKLHSCARHLAEDERSTFPVG